MKNSSMLTTDYTLPLLNEIFVRTKLFPSVTLITITPFSEVEIANYLSY